MDSEVNQNMSEVPANEEDKAELNAEIFQIALLNNLLPMGYRLEPYENAKKNEEFKTGKRKTAVFIDAS